METDYQYTYDLNYYFNPTNIPNQDLVFETYNFFETDEWKDFFNPLDFLNILYWHYDYIGKNLDKPFDVIEHFMNLQLSPKDLHILFGFILKWFGGYPVNNLNAQYNTVLRLIEKEYLKFTEINNKQRQDIINEGLAGKTPSNESSMTELEKEATFLFNLDNIIAERKGREKLRKLENQINSTINITHTEQSVKKDSEFLIFISHSSKDQELVTFFTDKVLQLAMQIKLENIFCTSIEACSITSGEDFRNVIKQRLTSATYVIQIITQDYKKSEVCLNEMGAAWVLSSKVKPFILNPVSYSSVGFIHHPNQLLKLDDTNDILKFIDELKLNNLLKHTEVQRHVEEFVKIVKEKFVKIEIEATFNGDFQEFIRSIIKSHIDELTDEGVSGTCVVRFIVTKDGNVKNAQALTMKNSKLARIAVNALNNCPKWYPATQNGRPVNAYREQPITFTIEE